MNGIKPFWLFIGMFCFWQNMSAQTLFQGSDTLEIEEITIREVKIPHSVVSTYPVQAVSHEQIKRYGYQNLADVLKRFTGITVKDYGGIGGLKTVSVRGLGAQHTLVSYDGVAVSDMQAGQIDIGRFPLENLGEIAVAVGQQEDIFQPTRLLASGGIVALKTSRPLFKENKNTALRASLKTGSFGYVNPYLQYASKLSDRLTLSMEGNMTRADGNYPFTLVNGEVITKEKRYNSDILSFYTEGNISYRSGENSALHIKIVYYDSERGLPGSVILYNPYHKERLWDKNFFVQGQYTRKFASKFQLKAQLKYNNSLNKYRDQKADYPGGVLKEKHNQNEYYVYAGVLYQPLAGLSLSFAQDLVLNTLYSSHADVDHPRRYTSLTALTARYRHREYTVTGTVVSAATNEDVKSGNIPEDKHRITPSIGITLTPSFLKNINIRFLCKQNYRLPSFNELYYQQVGNRNLKPELAREYNAGVTYWTGPFSILDILAFTIDGYINQVEDKITLSTPSPYVSTMVNTGKVKISGIDINVMSSYSVHDDVKIRLSGGYSYQKAVDITDPGKKYYKHTLPYTPKHSGNGAVNLETPWLGISYTLLGVGKRYVRPLNIPANRIDGYIEHSLTLYKECCIWDAEMRFQAELVNFTNEQYDVIRYYPMPGRSFRIGINTKI